MVEDTLAATVKTYSNPSGTLASVADTSAFSGTASQAVASDAAASIAQGALDFDALMRQLDKSDAALPEAAEPGRTSACAADSRTLCLTEDDFQVQWAGKSRRRGRAARARLWRSRAIPAISGSSPRTNVELVIKAVDGAS